MNFNMKSKYIYIDSNDEEISDNNTVKDLGIIMNNRNTFTEHITSIASKAQQQCGWILRTFKSRHITIMKTLWTSIVQPHIDYCSQLWMPSKVCEIQQIE